MSLSDKLKNLAVEKLREECGRLVGKTVGENASASPVKNVVGNVVSELLGKNADPTKAPTAGPEEDEPDVEHPSSMKEIVGNVVSEFLGKGADPTKAPTAAPEEDEPDVELPSSMKEIVGSVVAEILGRNGGPGAVPLPTAGDSESRTVVFDELPGNLAELKALPQAALASPFDTAALAIAALCQFERDPDALWETLDFLKGPEDVSESEKQFIAERLKNKAYKARSFFKGATPKNNYAPTRPYSVVVSANPRSFAEENWSVLYVQSGGADSPRPIRLRRKPSTGQWFVNEIMCLGDIRLPVDEDKWA